MLRRLLDFVYPALCRHCHASLQDRTHLLCSLCAENLVLCDPANRCRLCFRSTQGRAICPDCAEQPIVYNKCAAACENEGPALTLLSQYRQNAPQLFKALGSLMAMQVLQLNWPVPDLIVSIPSARMQIFKRGFDCNQLLAEQIGRILGRPTGEILKCPCSFQTWFDETIEFIVKKRSQVCDQRLLLVMDRFEKERARAASSALRDAFPLEIHVISIC
jgi:predicted amidophosphoribosyltransferase